MRICARYSEQCGQSARCPSRRLAVAGVERPVEVRGHQLDGLAADEGATAATEQADHRAPPSSSVSSARSLARPRCSRTRWFPSEMPSSDATSSAEHAVDVAQHHDLALVLGQLGEEVAAPGPRGPRPPCRSSTWSDQGTGGRGPRARGVEPLLDGVVGPPGALLAADGRPGPVQEDAEQPGLERRPALEPLDAAHHRQPRVLRDLLGHRPRPDAAWAKPHQPRLVARDELHERGLVAGLQPRDELRVLHADGTLERRFASITLLVSSGDVTDSPRRRPPSLQPGVTRESPAGTVLITRPRGERHVRTGDQGTDQRTRQRCGRGENDVAGRGATGSDGLPRWHLRGRRRRHAS